jgi:hypothetical protein
LFLPRTATLGALISLASMGQVFLMNMTFDVPVKILSFHLLAMSVVLLVPQAPAADESLRSAASDGAGDAAAAVRHRSRQPERGGRPKPELYGIWSVTEFTRDGRPVPPSTVDVNRWQRVVFDVPQVVTYQRMNGELVDAPATVDGSTLTLTTPDQPAPLATPSFERPSPDLLRLDGKIDGAPVTMSLERVDLQAFTLRNRGFNWVQEYPYFR